jgi:hypothetical protein
VAQPGASRLVGPNAPLRIEAGPLQTEADLVQGESAPGQIDVARWQVDVATGGLAAAEVRALEALHDAGVLPFEA